MSLGWSSLPLLPLRCVLDHLSTEDALAAMSTCRHWRSAVLLYEGHKETLKLRTGHLEKCLFMTRIFRKHTRKLHIYVEKEGDLEKFVNFVLPQFFDTKKLNEIIFIGPSYVKQSQHILAVKLKRIITESLVFKHLHCIQKLAFLGCELGTVNSENERYSHKQIDYYSRPLSFNSVQSPSDAVLSTCNAKLLMFSTLKHVIVDYEQINTQALETLSNLTNFTQLSLNIIYKKHMSLKPIDWHRLQECFTNGLDVAVNIIALPYRKFNDVIENVLVEGLTLTSLKVMFCKSLYTPLLSHVVRLYQSTLRELVWADSPYESSDAYHRIVRPVRQLLEADTYNVNPFILLCWQCVHLRRLVIHGYWVWQYDLLGFVRLRKSLSQLEVSAVYSRQDRFSAAHASAEGAVRVLAGDTPAAHQREYVNQVNEYTELEWKPTPWSELHPALRARSSPLHRAEYIVHEVSQPLGVT